jgi:hypothetical protein
MIIVGNKRIVDVLVSGTYITKGIFIDANELEKYI